MAFLYYFKIILILLHLSITLKLCSCKQLFFSLSSIMKGTSQETEVLLDRVKRSCLSAVIGRFGSILFVSVFQDLLVVTITIL